MVSCGQTVRAKFPRHHARRKVATLCQDAPDGVTCWYTLRPARYKHACECASTCLVVCLLLHVSAVHCHHTVPSAQPRRFCRGAGLHFADELSALPFLSMQVKSIPGLPFYHETKPRFQLAGHFHPSFFFFFFKTSLQCSVQVWLIRRWEFRRAGAGLNFHRAKTYLPDAHAFPHVRETLRTRRKQLQMHFRKRNPTLENTCNGGQQSKSLGKRWCDQSSRSCVLCRALLATPKTDPWQRAQTSTAPHRRYRRRVPNDAQGSPLLETLIHNNCAVDMHAVIL